MTEVPSIDVPAPARAQCVGPGRERALQPLAVEEQVDLLVEERDPGRRCPPRPRSGVLVEPGDVLVPVDREVARMALIGALGPLRARAQLRAHVLARQIGARRAGACPRTAAVPARLCASTCPSSSTRTSRELGRISIAWNGSRGWAKICSSSSYQASKPSKSRITWSDQVRVGGPEAHGRASVAVHAQAQRLAVRGVHGERDRRVEDQLTLPARRPGESLAVGVPRRRGGRDQVAQDVLRRHRVGRDDAPRLVHQQRPRVVSTATASPTSARTRFLTGSCRNSSNPCRNPRPCDCSSPSSHDSAQPAHEDHDAKETVSGRNSE